MKRRTSVLLTEIIILVIGLTGTLLYLKSTVNSTLLNFEKTLKQSGHTVKDVTKDYAQKSPDKIPKNQKILNVDGNDVFVSIEESKTIDSTIQKNLEGFQNPLVDYSGIPHLYHKGNLLVTYFGDNKNLLKALEETLGKSLIN